MGIFLGLLLLQLVMTVYYHRNLKVNMISFFNQVLMPISIPFVMMLWLGWKMNSFTTYGWPTFILKIVGYSLVYVPVASLYLFKFNKLKRVLAPNDR